jgi:hypothetical protein
MFTTLHMRTDFGSTYIACIVRVVEIKHFVTHAVSILAVEHRQLPTPFQFF